MFFEVLRDSCVLREHRRPKSAQMSSARGEALKSLLSRYNDVILEGLLGTLSNLPATPCCVPPMSVISTLLEHWAAGDDIRVFRIDSDTRWLDAFESDDHAFRFRHLCHHTLIGREIFGETL